MDTNFYLDVNKFATFLSKLADEVPNTPLTRDIINRIIDFTKENMEGKVFCPYGFTEIDREVCEVCKEGREG